MKRALLLLSAAAGAASIGVPSVTQDFNITSPLDHGVYVAGQKLPITYVLLGDSTGIELNIYLCPVDVNATSVIIAQNADVSEDASSVVTIDNHTYWQHSYNHNIPQNAIPGSYEVVFESLDAKANTSVPISIRPYVSSTPAAPMATGSPSVPASSSDNTSSRKSSSGSRAAAMSSGVALVGFIAFFSSLLKY